MKMRFCDLIVIARESPSINKIRISSQAMLILFGAFVLSFSRTVFQPKNSMSSTDLGFRQRTRHLRSKTRTWSFEPRN